MGLARTVRQMIQGCVTLVLPAETELPRWSAADRARFTVIRDVDFLEQTLHSAIFQAAGDAARVVVDGGTTLDRFLILISSLPDTFRGEILFINRDGSGYLSTWELKTVRTVRNLGAAEVEIYLRWHGLPARPRTSYGQEKEPFAPEQLFADKQR
jgi:hypothetical protein